MKLNLQKKSSNLSLVFLTNRTTKSKFCKNVKFVLYSYLIYLNKVQSESNLRKNFFMVLSELGQEN